MNRTVKRTLVIIIGIIIISGIIWFAVDRRQKTINTAQTPVIVSAPNPRIGEALPPDVQAPPATPETKPLHKPPVAVVPQPRGPATAPGTVTVQPRIYRNDQLRFSMVMPVSWSAANDTRLSHEIFFVTASNQPQGSVEAYDAPAQETSNSLERTLHGDPHAYNFERVSYRGQPGIGYWLKGDVDEHFAFIVNGKIYYVHGAEVLARLNFI